MEEREAKKRELEREGELWLKEPYGLFERQYKSVLLWTDHQQAGWQPKCILCDGLQGQQEICWNSYTAGRKFTLFTESFPVHRHLVVSSNRWCWERRKDDTWLAFLCCWYARGWRAQQGNHIGDTLVLGLGLGLRPQIRLGFFHGVSMLWLISIWCRSFCLFSVSTADNTRFNFVSILSYIQWHVLAFQEPISVKVLISTAYTQVAVSCSR